MFFMSRHRWTLLRTAGAVALMVGCGGIQSSEAQTTPPPAAGTARSGQVPPPQPSGEPQPRQTQSQERTPEQLRQTPPPQQSGAARQNQPQERAAAAAESGRPPAQPYTVAGRRTPYVAEYLPDGRLVRPIGWREWPFIGTPLTPNRLNLPEAPFPEFHIVYVEPTAWEHFKRTGEFREGTVIVKELVRQQINSTTDPANGAITESSGKGYFMAEDAGLEAAVKDSRRFANEPGQWAYFSFGHVPEAQYASATEVKAVETCNACHAANAGRDFVFIQHSPVLRGLLERVGKN